MGESAEGWHDRADAGKGTYLDTRGNSARLRGNGESWVLGQTNMSRYPTEMGQSEINAFPPAVKSESTATCAGRNIRSFFKASQSALTTLAFIEADQARVDGAEDRGDGSTDDMVDIRNRTENPSPNIAFQEIYIPDDANLGTGLFRALVKKDALALPTESEPETVIATADDPSGVRFQLDVNRLTRDISVLLGRTNDSLAVCAKTFFLLSGIDTSVTHEFEAVFRNWRVLSLKMDGQELNRNFQADFICQTGVQDEIVRDKLAAFVAAYNEAVCDIFAARSDGTLTFHAEQIERLSVIRASDGFLVAYHPHHESFRDGAGEVYSDLSKYDLNTVCQWLTAHLLRVRYPDLGKPYEPPTPVPDTRIEEPVIPGMFGIMLHPEIRAYLKSTAIGDSPTPPFPAVQVTPFVRYEQGIAIEIVPCRFKLWSPIVDVPGLGRRRLYHWTHADIWWYPDQLNLDPAQAPHVAQIDLLAFDAVVSAVAVFSPKEAERDVPQHASEVLERSCSEFELLLDTAGHDEEKIHQWLNMPAHHLFLDLPPPSKVWSKIPFGKTVSDFAIRCTDGRYKVIEIERATLRIFQEKGQEPTAHFNHACNQIRDWQLHVREHVHEVREVRGLTDIYEPRGVVMMGRTRDIDSDASRRRWRHLKSDFNLEVYTYDEICDRVRQLASTLRNLPTNL